MSVPASAGPASVLRRVHAPILLGIPVLALALLGPGPRTVEVLVGLAGIAASVLLRARPQPWASELWAVPALLTTGAVALASEVTISAELLAGAAALAVVYWIASEAPGVRIAGSPSQALLLPGLAVALAVSVTLFLPAGPELVGVASVLMVGLFFGLAAALQLWSEAPEGEAHAQ